jgi:hypothetical protein
MIKNLIAGSKKFIVIFLHPIISVILMTFSVQVVYMKYLDKIMITLDPVISFLIFITVAGLTLLASFSLTYLLSRLLKVVNPLKLSLIAFGINILYILVLFLFILLTHINDIAIITVSYWLIIFILTLYYFRKYEKTRNSRPV